MAIGTAGYTAMLALMALERHGLTPAVGILVVTGASGGLGSFAVALLADRGFTVAAATGFPPGSVTTPFNDAPAACCACPGDAAPEGKPRALPKASAPSRQARPTRQTCRTKEDRRKLTPDDPPREFAHTARTVSHSGVVERAMRK